MDLYFFIRTVHILSATILFGTGLGIAFFMFRSRFFENNHEKLFAAKTTVLADTVFTLPAGIVQPLSGVWLIWHAAYEPLELWLLASYCLYILAALCWLPVVWIQIQLKKMLIEATKAQADLPERYDRLFRYWFYLGWPAFIALILIFFLMVVKPA